MRSCFFFAGTTLKYSTRSFTVARIFPLKHFPNEKIWTLPNWKIFLTTILNLMKMARVLQEVRKHSGKRRNRSLRAISPFPTVFSKDLYCRHAKATAYL